MKKWKAKKALKNHRELIPKLSTKVWLDGLADILLEYFGDTSKLYQSVANRSIYEVYSDNDKEDLINQSLSNLKFLQVYPFRKPKANANTINSNKFIDVFFKILQVTISLGILYFAYKNYLK